MAIERKGQYSYGESAADVEAEIVDYSRSNGYLAVRFAEAKCACASSAFRLDTDEDEGVGRRTCSACGAVRWIGDSAQFADGARPQPHVCVCDGDMFRLVCGVALYEGSNDVRWFYIGCLCTTCRLVGVFADWKCEAGDADVFLAGV